MSWRPDWRIIRELFRFGLPTGVQGIAMNVAGVLLLRFIGSLPQSAQAQAAYAVSYSEDRKSTRLNSSHSQISYAVFCLKKKEVSLPLSRLMWNPAVLH